MSSPYVGEIRMFAGNFAPVGWALCQGQIIPISENETLFNLIGTTYGGDGQETFALPDLQSRVPIHTGTDPQTGTAFVIGQSAGTESVTLTTNQMPVHNHGMQAAASSGNSASPANALPAVPQTGSFVYSSTAPAVTMGPAIGSSGGSQPHDNMVPFLVINFIISLYGIYPSPS